MQPPSNYASAFIFSLVILLCAIIWWYRKRITGYKDIPSIPIAELLKSTLLVKNPKGIPRASFLFQVIIKILKQYQSDEGILYSWIFRHYLFITGQEAFKFFSKEAAKKSHNYDVIKEMFGNGLVTNDGEPWKKQRKLLDPAFNVSLFKDRLSNMNKYADIFIEELMELQKESVNILEPVRICTISIAYEYITGLDAKERRKELERVLYLTHMVSDKVMERSFHPLRHHKLTQYLSASGRQYMKDLEEVQLFMTKISLEMKESILLRQNNKELDETNECRSVTSKTFSQILVERHLKDESFTVEHMRDEVFVFLAAGYESSSLIMMFCIFLLGHHEDIQDQVYNELESVTNKNYLTIDDLSKLTYLDAVIKETLRLYPAIPIYGRHLEKCVQFEKYNIPKDTTLLFFPYLYHRDPKYFPDPEKFFPERFLEANAENRPLTFAFAEGARNCIGQKFAMMEMKIILTHLLRKFKVISLTKMEDINLNWTVNLSTVEPVYVRLSHRQEGTPVK